MKLNLKKVIATALTAIFIPAFLAGCGATKEKAPESENPKATNIESTKNESNSPKKKTKIVWWTFQRHDMEYMFYNAILHS